MPIIPIEKLDIIDTHLAGGKGASLGKLLKHKLLVPPGFVISTKIFEHTLGDQLATINNLLHKTKSSTVSSLHELEKISNEIRSIIHNANIDNSYLKDINTAFDKLQTDFVAVRSSAPEEDGRKNAWAGQLESYLHTHKNTLVENIKKCWTSAFSPKVLQYRFYNNIYGNNLSIAVVIQAMIHSEYSGVAFSVHPVTNNNNQIVIEAAYGLGEAVVSGKISPDTYIADKTSASIVEKNISRKTKQLIRNRGGGTVWETVLPNLQGAQVISDDDISKLTKIIVKIEKYYGIPVDIEWAVQNNTFYILQCRPISTL